MRASVVVPTRNRAARLDALLASLAAQSCGADDFEVVVADNGSTDGTARVVEAWAARRPRVRHVVEPAVGVSRARNTGAGAARAPILAFLDDDVIAEPGWLDALLRGYERFPDAAIVCGRADLELAAPPPPWFGPEVAGWYSVLDFGAEPRRLTDPDEVPWALNLSARADTFRAVGGFPEHLGRIGNDLRGGEEAPFVAHVRASGAAVAYEPDARVRHVVAADRLRVAWLFRRAWQGGLNAHASAAAGGRPVPGGPTAALGHVALRGWRAAYRRSRNADTVREALLSELCHRTAGLAQLRSVRGERR